ncbi:hypothetical protein, variant [Allomyces macrogynus ATCC 38327]|uniref:Uncharacterized protein n=1 Tax=Allomyces macrogynus (strain ATCC 38327) TaxID=578462 RepID=A0A0L0SB76_ALLM3|nr:hypothetical protein, variant [Allomyces macrogynus ATCC 38327]|eukprot:KNE59818.1 hypothetical protein, variant [Allomyces macrogynus ATCC 38327]
MPRPPAPNLPAPPTAAAHTPRKRKWGAPSPPRDHDMAEATPPRAPASRAPSPGRPSPTPRKRRFLDFAGTSMPVPVPAPSFGSAVAPPAKPVWGRAAWGSQAAAAAPAEPTTPPRGSGSSASAATAVPMTPRRGAAGDAMDLDSPFKRTPVRLATPGRSLLAGSAMLAAAGVPMIGPGSPWGNSARRAALLQASTTPRSRLRSDPIECKPSPFYRPEEYKASPDRIVIVEDGAQTPPAGSPIPAGLQTPRRPPMLRGSPGTLPNGKPVPRPPSVRRLFANVDLPSSDPPEESASRASLTVVLPNPRTCRRQPQTGHPGRPPVNPRPSRSGPRCTSNSRPPQLGPPNRLTSASPGRRLAAPPPPQRPQRSKNLHVGNCLAPLHPPLLLRPHQRRHRSCAGSWRPRRSSLPRTFRCRRLRQRRIRAARGRGRGRSRTPGMEPGIQRSCRRRHGRRRRRARGAQRQQRRRRRRWRWAIIRCG